MDTKETLLREVFPNVAMHLRSTASNLYGAMQHAMPPERQEASAENRQLTAIWNHSYYQTLQTLNNLDAAPSLLDDSLYQTENTELVSFFDCLCDRAIPLAEAVGLKLSFECSLTAHVAAAEPRQLERLLWQLLSNAIKYTAPGGSITVSLRLERQQVLLSVTDTGCGIAQEDMDTLFEKYLHFEPLKLKRGVGLGLALSRQIALRHGGRLMIRSQVGKGTQVTVALPDRRTAEHTLRTPGFDYNGGFSSVLVGLADALPYQLYGPEHTD